jgi:hypothetical protein
MGAGLYPVAVRLALLSVRSLTAGGLAVRLALLSVRSLTAGGLAVRLALLSVRSLTAGGLAQPPRSSLNKTGSIPYFAYNAGKRR